MILIAVRHNVNNFDSLVVAQEAEFAIKFNINVQGVLQSQTAANPDTKRKRKRTKTNMRKTNKRTRST